jgi:hypothetical protein
VEIQNERVKLAHIFLANLWASAVDREDSAAQTYQKLIDVAGRTGVEVELKKAA